uniref:DB domain-containing protein n=1 Tax=Syphacia muris TaxID=451379 RepID=A0A0N5AYV5_9BILA
MLYSLVIFLLAIAVQDTEQCAANGICGGMPYCSPMMSPAPLTCSCPPSYGCGQYGCYRLRARGSKNFQPYRSRGSPIAADDEEVPNAHTLNNFRLYFIIKPLNRSATCFQNPNTAFYECCLDRQLPDACLRKCNFNSYNKETLTAMYFKQDPCPLEAMKEMQFCAAQGQDHRECCARNGVTTTLAGFKCLTFCDQRPGIITKLDMSYVSCFDRFENMKSCFWHDINQHLLSKSK